MARPLLKDLLEGEDSTPVDERDWPTPQQWLYQFNRLDPQARIEQIERTIRDAKVYMNCLYIEDHKAIIQDLTQKLELRDSQVRALQRELGTKKRILRQKNRRV